MSQGDNDLKAELGRLQAEIESYRQRELADLRQRCSEAEQLRDHYRQEAQRNADVGRQIAADLQKQLAELKTKLEVYEQLDTSARRPTR